MNATGGLLKFIEQFLIAVVIASAGYVIFFGVHRHQLQPASVPEAAETKEETPVPVDILPELKSYEVYAQQLNSRDIFAPVSHTPAAVELPSAAAPSAGLPATMKVVGILNGPPSEVMVEDTASHETYFIQEGGEPQAGIALESIDGDKVTLNYKGKPLTVNIKDNRAHP